MTPTSRRLRTTTAVTALLAAAALAGPPVVSANTTPAVNGTTLTLTGDDAPDRVVVGEDAGLLTLTVNGTATDLGAALPANNTIDLIANAGGGDDEITITTANLKSVTADGGAGDDVLTGNNDADTLSGGDGDDRVIGARAGDTMNGGAGNDVLVWNNGDGSDTMNGGDNADEVEVNGAVSQGDVFTIAPNGARTDFDRTNLVLFSLDVDAERMTINGLGGDDTMTSTTTLPLTLNGGTGADQLTGGAGTELITGGDDVDALVGGGGNDRLVGDRGNDAMDGGAGDDTLVWNNGDNSDRMDGGDGLDRVEVNGAAGGADVFTIAPNGARAKFDRTSLVPFTLDIAAEALDVRGLAGDDQFSASQGTGALLAVTADGGSGNDTLTGADEADTFSGGAGDDTMTGGNGADLLDGQDGNDVLRARDGQNDLVRGGAGTDSAQTDAIGTDLVDAVESVDAAAIAAPPADTEATAVSVRSRRAAVKIRRGRASTKLSISCPAGEAGGCIGTVTLTTAKPVKIGSERVIAVLGSARYSLKAGERKTVTVALSKSVRKLAAKKALAARAQTVTRDAAGNVAVGSRAVSLRVKK